MDEKELITLVLMNHYPDMEWSKTKQGFRCVCGNYMGLHHYLHLASVMAQELAYRTYMPNIRFSNVLDFQCGRY